VPQAQVSLVEGGSGWTKLRGQRRWEPRVQAWAKEERHIRFEPSPLGFLLLLNADYELFILVKYPLSGGEQPPDDQPKHIDTSGDEKY